MDVKKTDKTLQYIVTGIVVVAALGIGFGGGVVYQKGKSPKTTTASNGGTTNSRFGASGGLGRRAAFGQFGTVSAVTDTSITVTSRRSNTPMTYTITSSTKILNGTATASASDIKVGDTVMIQVSTTTNTEATQITLNPQLPTGAGQQGSTQSGTDNQMPATQTN